MELKENADKLVDDLNRRGYKGDAHREKIMEYLSRGLTNFTLLESHVKDQQQMDLSLKILYSEKHDRHLHDSTTSLIIKDFPIPPAVLKGVVQHELEDQLRQMVYQNPAMTSVQEAATLKDLANVAKQAPDTAAALIAKYNPDVTKAAIPADVIEKSNKLVAENSLSLNVSTYYNLSPREIHNLTIDDNRWVFKRLYRNQQNDDGKMERVPYEVYIQPNKEKLRNDGTQDMITRKAYGIIEKLGALNLEETTKAKLYTTTELIKAGEKIEAHNLNKGGLPIVHVKGDAAFNTVTLSEPKTNRILPHLQYKRDPVLGIQTNEGMQVKRQSEIKDKVVLDNSVQSNRLATKTTTDSNKVTASLTSKETPANTNKHKAGKKAGQHQNKGRRAQQKVGRTGRH